MKNLQKHFYLIVFFHILFTGCGSYSSDEDKMDGSFHTVVSSMSPNDGEASVYTNTSVSVTFSKEMNSSTITTNSSDTSCSGTLQVSSDSFSTCVQMSASPTASNSNKTFSVTPSSRLPYATNYKVRLSNVIKSDSGENILDQYTTPTGFTSINITVSSTSPADSETSVNTNSNISITLSEPVDTSTVTTNTSDTSCSGTFQVSSNNFSTCIRMSDSPGASSDNRTFTVTPNSTLANPVTYKIRVTTGVKDNLNHTLSSQYESAVGFRTLGSYVAVGSAGNIWSTIDTVSWTSRTSGTTENLNGITYGNNTFVAVGNSGTILTSQDGITWDNRASGTTQMLRGIAYGNNTFVGVGGGGVIIRSTDNGTSWDNVSSTGYTIFGVTFGNDRFVLVGYGILSGNIYPLRSFASYSLDNGTSWQGGCSNQSQSRFLAVAYGNNIFSIVGGDGDYNSEFRTLDGSNCQHHSSGKYGHQITSVAFGNNKFVSVGNKGIYYSSNGKWWYGEENDLDFSVNTITFGNGTFLAMGGGNIATTPDGSNLTIRTISDFSNLSFNGVTYAE